MAKKTRTKRYLSKSAKELFWRFFLFLPYLMWLYSIGIELNKKNSKYYKINKILLHILIEYLFIYTITVWFFTFLGILDLGQIFPFDIVAMICSFTLMLLITSIIINFEKSENFKQSNRLDLFFGIFYFIFGIWYIQPKLNEYVKRLDNSE